MKKMPCLNCKKREIGCHDGCDDYQSAKKNKNSNAINAERDLMSYYIDKKEKMRRTYGGYR